MKENDYSKEIYDKYCNSEGRILQIFLKDGSMLEGIFGGYFHGDIEVGEPYVIKWHFIPKLDIDKYNSVVLTESTDTLGRIIKQEEIDRVQFKKKK